MTHLGNMQGTAKQTAPHTIIAVLIGAALMIWALLGSAPVYAQGLDPLTVEKDPNGVDILSGKTTARTPTLSIPAAPSLAFSKMSDWNLFIQGTYSGGEPESAKINYSVNAFGAESESLKCTGLDFCEDTKGRGSMIRGNYRSGVVLQQGQTGHTIQYNLREGSQGLINSGDAFAYRASSVLLASGELLTLNWTPTTQFGMVFRRLASVSSSTGYSLTFTYVSDTFSTANDNWYKPKTAQIQASANPGVPLAKFTYTYSGSAVSIVDLAGRQFDCTSCSMILPGQPVPATSLKLPDAGTTVSFTAEAASRNHGGPDTHAQFTTSVETDGVVYGYDYDEDPTSTSLERRINGVTMTGPANFGREYFITNKTYNSGCQGCASKASRIDRVKDSWGRQTTYTYTSDQANEPEFYRVASITKPEGNASEAEYDDLGRVTKLTAKAKPGSVLTDIVQTATYPSVIGCSDYATQRPASCFLPDTTTDAKGNVTSYDWEDHGGLKYQLEPPHSSGKYRKTAKTWDTNGPARVLTEVLCEANASATCTDVVAARFRKAYTYWNNTALPLTETVSAGDGSDPLTTTFEYDAAGRLLKQNGPLAGDDDAMFYRYDTLGRRTWEIGPKGENGKRPVKISSYRDMDDQVWKVETGHVTNPTDTVYDQHSFATVQFNWRRIPIRTVQRGVDANGGIAIYGVSNTNYDTRNRAKCTAVRMDPAEFNTNYPNACVPTTLSASANIDRITRTYYDRESRVTKIDKAYGTPLEQTYATYTYSLNGNQTSMTDARGYRAEMVYDGFDRQTHWYFPDPATPGLANTGDFEQYTYDANGNRVTLRKRDGSVISYNYDALNRVSVKTMPYRAGLAAVNRRDVYYRYDLRDLQTGTWFDALESADGTVTNFDTHGRPTWTLDTMGTWSLRIDSEYDAAGNRTRLTYPGGAKFDYCYTSGGQFDKVGFYNSCPNAASAGLVDFTYDARGQLTGAARASAALDQTFSYDPVGRMSFNAWGGSNDTDAVSWTLSRNPASQINTQTLTNTAYSWDARLPGLATTNYQTNGLNQYTDINSTGHCYDANGNLTGDGTDAYLYDIENRLVAVRDYVSCTGGAASYSGTIRATLYYDPAGRLHEVRNFVNGTVNNRTKFLYDGDAMIAEYNGGNSLLRRHLHGPVAGADDPLVTFEGTTATYSNATFLYADVRGSIAYRSNAAGTSTAINTYDPYGQPGTANAGRFQYTGQAWLDEVGLYHYKARFYSPILGRFLQVDPIGYEDQVNLYAYVGNDPINGVDPTGLCEKQTGSRICRNERTTLVKSVTIPIRDENGNSNSSIAAQTTKDYTAEAIDRTEESEFSREHGVTLSEDKEAQTYVVSLFQGPRKGLFGGGSLNIVPTDRKLLYSVHTHTAVGVQQPAIPTIIRNWSRGGTNTPGPSSTGAMNDRESAQNWRRINNPNARFAVIYRTPTPGGGTKWNYEGY